MDLGYESSKRILILKANFFSLSATETFLRHRGWDIVSTTNVKEALLKLLEKKFTYVLLSVDHPNKKINSLPQLISHKFSTVVICFAEGPSARSYNALTYSDTRYKIYFPVTGPAVERCITKYLRDQQATPAQIQPPLYFFTGEKRKGKANAIQATGTVTGEFGHLKRNDKHVEYQQRHFSQKRKRSDALDTLIVRGTEKSLLGTVDFLDGFVLHKIENTTNSGCIVVESERFSGYIVAAMGQNRKFEESFLGNIKKMLFKYLKDNGEHVTESEIMDVQLKTVDFEPWALEYGDFLRKSVHQGDEVAVAFFPRRPVNINFENSQRRDMAKIRLLDLRGDRQVEFDLYIHLANNDKYLLYTPKGGVFYQKQLDRLKQQGVTHMHVEKNATEDVSKYHAQNYLNELVEAFDY